MLIKDITNISHCGARYSYSYACMNPVIDFEVRKLNWPIRVA